jgi:hypothetical protein
MEVAGFLYLYVGLLMDLLMKNTPCLCFLQ